MIAAIKALLAGLGAKDYLYGIFIAALLASGTTWYIKHNITERAIGAAVVQKKDAALLAAATALNTASVQLADIKELDIGRIYEKHISEPPVANGGLVCRTAAAAAEQSQAASNRPANNGASAAVSDGSFDPSGALLTLLSDSDAQIDALIDTVLNLEAELQGVTK